MASASRRRATHLPGWSGVHSTTAAARLAVPRRAFLRVSLAGAVGFTSLGQATSAEAEPAPAIDAHTHFYDPTRPQGVPWPDKGDKVLYRKVLPGELKELAGKHGVR